MFFLPAICLGLGITFAYFGRQGGNSVMMWLGFCMVVAAVGTSLITFFALQTLN